MENKTYMYDLGPLEQNIQSLKIKKNPDPHCSNSVYSNTRVLTSNIGEIVKTTNKNLIIAKKSDNRSELH